MFEDAVLAGQGIERIWQLVGPHDHLALHPIMKLSTVELSEIDGHEVEELAGKVADCGRSAC